MKDWRGTEVKVGDHVIYPGRQGSRMWTTEAEVVELLPGNPDAESYWDRTPHALRVRRLRDSTSAVTPKVVPVKLSAVTVVETVEALEWDRVGSNEEDLIIDGGAT